MTNTIHSSIRVINNVNLPILFTIKNEVEYYIPTSFPYFCILNKRCMKISIGNDHAGTSYKKAIQSYLEAEGHTVANYGTDEDASVDYPDFGHPVATDVENGDANFGIVICGSGNGIAMSVNKHQGVRAALCWIKEIAILAREHNNANVIAIPARYTSENQVLEIVKAFLNTDFEGGRHQRRVDKIACQ